MQTMRTTVAKGFTLVEILIVVVILGILAAIVVPQFTNAANDARQGNVETQGSTLQNQLELYAAQNNGSYPTVAELNDDWAVMIDGNYIKDIPVNPFGGGTGVTAMEADTAAEANAAANASEAAGWLYDADSGLIRAAGGSYTVAEEEEEEG